MNKNNDKTESGPTFYQTARGKLLPSVYASALGRYYPYGGTFDMPRQQMYMPLDHVNAGGGYLAPILPMHFDKGTKIFRDTTALPFADGGPLNENKGVHYKYPGKNSEYLKQGDKWYISNNYTDFKFIPIHDPKGTRAKELNKNAVIYKNADKMSTADYEGKLNASLNNAMTRASRAGEFYAPNAEDPIDNFRHPMAGRFTAEAIAKKTGNIPYISNALGFLGANALGIAHEASTIFSDKRPWDVKLREAGEDIYNNAVGAKVGASNMSPHAKTNYLDYLSYTHKIPDGYGEIHPFHNKWVDPYNQKANGGKLMDFPAPSLSERETNINYNIYASMPGRYYSNGGQFLTAGGEYHRIYKNAEGDIMVNHPAEDKGKWDTINLTDKANAHTVAQGVAATKQWHLEHPNAYSNGGMIKRADGSYSQRGLWDNIRANKGSGKKPTKEMLAQERKIRANEHSLGGNIVKASHLFGMGGHKAVFFPTNVSEPGAADKDLTYPKDAYVYAEGGHLFPDGGGLITYKTHGKLINSTGNFNAISKVNISPEYNEQIKHRLYTGKWGFNPETGTLELLKAKDRAIVGKQIRDIRAEEENVKAYNKSMEEAGGVDPRLMHPKTKMSQEEINKYVKEGYNLATFNPVFKTAAYFTPWGMAAGAIEGGVNLIPDLYKGNYGAAAMDAAATLPFVGSGVRRIAYNAIEPVGYGVLEKLKNAPETFVRSVTNPSGRPLRVGKELVKGASKEFPEEQLIEMGKNRLDSWRLGLKMPQKYDTFEQIGDNTYRIKNMKPEIGRLSAIDKDIKAYELSKNPGTFEADQAELKKLFAQHDEIANPSKEIGDINSIRRYLMKSGNINTPAWQQIRIVEKSLQPEFTHSVYDIDPQGIMGSHRWDVRKDPTGLLHYQANDTWNLNPFENRGHTKLDEGELGRKILSKYHFKPLEKLEALKLIGGKPFEIQNNFAVDPNTFKVINSWKNGGHMPTEKTIIRTSELFK